MKLIQKEGRSVSVTFAHNPPITSTAVQNTTKIQNYHQLVEKIRKQIQANQQKFGLLSVEVFNTIFQQFTKYSFNEEKLRDLSTHLLRYMREGFNRTFQKKKNHKFIPEFGKKIRRVWDQAFFQNRNTLRVMSYLIKGFDQHDCYLNLRFDLDSKQTMAVATKTRQLCKYDLRAILYLTHYLYASCLNLDKQGKSLSDIEKIFVEAIGAISQAYPPAPQLRQSMEASIHKSYKKQADIQTNVIDLGKQKNKKEALTQFILREAEQASNNYNIFYELVEQACKQKGYHFKIGVKIKDQNQKRAIDRVTQKMIGKQFNKYGLNNYCVQHSKNQSISEFIKEEERLYQIQMQKIYSKVTEPIKFKVSDMLRAKCLFKTVTDINTCTYELKRKIENSDYKLVELDNRLNGQVKTSDIVLKILIKKTIAQLQLPIDFDVAENEFAHKIYEITRSKFFSPLTMLNNINEEIKNDYLKQVIECFKVNNANSQEHQLAAYNSSFMNKTFKDMSFKRIQKSFHSFLKIVGYKQKIQCLQKQQLILQKMKQQLDAIKRQSSTIMLPPEQDKTRMNVHKNNGEYLRQIKRFKHSLIQFEKYAKQIERALPAEGHIQTEEQRVLLRKLAVTHNGIGQVYGEERNYEMALKAYQRCLQIQEQVLKQSTIQSASTHGNIGNIHYFKGNYEIALKQYIKCLQIQEKIIGKDSINCAPTHCNIGNVYRKQGSYQLSLKQHMKCLEIQQRVLGKQTINCASSHGNIGNVYRKQGKYQKALKQYMVCLQIQQKIIGQQSIECAQTHNNIGGIHFLKGNYDMALNQHSRSLQIQERILGKQSINCSSTHNSIGCVYQSKGNYSMALNQYTKGLEIQQKVLGKQAIDCASSHVNIGNVYYSKGDYQMALKQYNRSLQIQSKIIGKQSLDCVTTYSAIGNVYLKQGNYDMALKQYTKSLQIKERVLGKEAFSCAAANGNISNIYYLKGNYEMALKGYLKCLQIQERSRGKQAINCSLTHTNIGNIYLKQSNLDMALKQYVRCLQIQERVLGKQAIQCAGTHNSIGNAYYSKGNYDQALNQFARCLEIQQKILGKQSLHSAVTIYMISRAHNRLGNAEQSKIFKERAEKLKQKYPLHKFTF